MKILKAAAVVGSAFAFGLSALTPFSASAAEIIRLTVAETRALIGESFDAQYYVSQNTYTTTFNYSGTGVIQPYDQNVDIDVLTGVPCLEYTASVNYGTSGYTVMSIDIPFVIPNCTYLDFFFLPWVNLSRVDSLTFQQYSQNSFYICELDDVQQTFQTFVSSTDGSQAARFRLGGAYGASGVSYCRPSYYSATNSSVEYSFLSVSYDCSYAENGVTKIYIPCPQVNSDYQGQPGPGPDIPAYIDVEGEASGTVQENSSGGYDITYNYNIQIPDYNGVINPALNDDQSSRMGDARDTVDEYHTAEEGLLSEADDGLSSLPDLEFDETLIEDAENPFSEFFGINLVGIMVFWVGAIAFISYVLFGKWV